MSGRILNLVTSRMVRWDITDTNIRIYVYKTTPNYKKLLSHICVTKILINIKKIFKK